jgi:tyrosine-protein kinase Etk/Wzc
MKPIDQPRSNLILPEQDGIAMTGYVDFLLRARWLILALAAAFTLIGAAYALLTKPVYQSDIMIQVEESPDPAKSTLSDISSLFDIKTEAATEIEILRSRLVISRAVDALHLDIDAEPRYFPLIGRFIAERNNVLSEPGINGYGGFAWGNERIRVKSFDVPDELYGKRFDLEFLGHGAYRLLTPDGNHEFEGSVGRLETFQTPEGAITLEASSIDAKPGIRFTLTRESRLKTVEDLQDRINIFEKTKQSGVIEATLECTNRALCGDVMHEIGKEYVSQNVERKAADAQQSLTFLDSQLPKLKQQLEESEARYAQFRDANHTFDLSSEGRQMLQDASSNREKLLGMQMQKADLLTRFSPTHPLVVSLDRQIGELEAAATGSDEAIRQLPDLERQTIGLLRDVQVNTELYTSLLNNAQQLRLMKAGKVGTVRLVDDAATSEQPVKPKKPLIVCLSLIVGIVFGMVVAFARKTFFGGISDPHEIEQLAGLDVVVAVPHSSEQQLMARQAKRAGTPMKLLAHRNPHDPTIESLRSLRIAAQFAVLSAKNNIVMLAGPTTGVGKSFISANFAEVLAVGGKRILLIDGDLHKGGLNEYFQVPRENGLSELLSGTKTIEEVTRRHIGSGIDFISTGTLPRDASELLMSATLRTNLEALSEAYDVVIVDSPPVLPISDAQVLGSIAGTVFLVARCGTNKLGEINESVKRLGLAGIVIKGVIFNGVKLSTRGYSYGSRYGRFRHEQHTYYAYGAESRKRA